MPTLITVVPVWNGARFIAATLASVAAQRRRPDRVVILDNGSTDGTKEAAFSVPGLRPEWRENERNLGMFGNMNRALDLAPEADYLHLLHADDLVKEDFYARMMASLESAPGRALAYCRSEFIDEAGNPARLGRRRLTDEERVRGVDDFLRQRAELRAVVCPSVVLKTARQAAPVRFREDMPQLADLVFWGEWAAAAGAVVCVPEILARYRVHPGSATRANASRLQSFVLDEWKAMELLEGLRRSGPWSARWRRETLRLIFAARSHDKAWAAQAEAPDFAEAIRRTARPVAGCWWYPGKFLVGLRMALHYLRPP